MLVVVTNLKMDFDMTAMIKYRRLSIRYGINLTILDGNYLLRTISAQTKIEKKMCFSLENLESLLFYVIWQTICLMQIETR